MGQSVQSRIYPPTVHETLSSICHARRQSLLQQVFLVYLVNLRDNSSLTRVTARATFFAIHHVQISTTTTSTHHNIGTLCVRKSLASHLVSACSRVRNLLFVDSKLPIEFPRAARQVTVLHQIHSTMPPVTPAICHVVSASRHKKNNDPKNWRTFPMRHSCRL